MNGISKMKAKKTIFAYEEAHPEDGPFCWNEGIMHEHHGWQTKKPKTIHVRQKLTTRPIEIYTEFEDLSEIDFKNVKKIEELYTDACEARFINVLKNAIYKYCETGVVPTLGEAMEDFDKC